MGILTTGQNILDQATEYADMTGTQFPNSSTFGLQRVNEVLSKLHYHLANGHNNWFAEQSFFSVNSGQEFFPLPSGTNFGATAWAPSTPYTSGTSYVIANSMIFVCTTSGTSASTGLGPAGCGFPIVDGTAQWKLAGVNYQRTQLDTRVPNKFYRMTKLYLHVSDRRYEITRMFRHETYGYTWAPKVSGQLDMLYVPEFTPLTSLANTIDTTYPAGWELYCAWTLARQLLAKEESSEAAAAAAQEAGDHLREIDSAIADRDSGYPQRVEDTTGRWQWTRRWLLARNYENNYEYTIEGGNLLIVEPATLP